MISSSASASSSSTLYRLWSSNLRSCSSTHLSFLVSWSASINKRLKPFSTKSEDQRKHRSFRFARNSSNLLNNKISHRTASKSLSQEQSYEISLELRRSLYLRSKLSMSLLQWHRQCNDLSSHRSIYQWIDSSISSHATSESASMISFVNAMIYKHIALSISESIRLSDHMQLVSLLQWHLFSMQWSICSHHSTHQWIWSYVHMQLVSLL